MNQPETFAVDSLDVTVEETADALSYKFVPREPAWRPGFPVGLALLFVGLPLAVAGLSVYAIMAANRPVWEEALTGLLVAQLCLWALLGTGGLFTNALSRWLYHDRGSVLTFTPTHMRHGSYGDRRPVCVLGDVRGVRLFIFPEAPRQTAASPKDAPPAEERPGRLGAGLSLVVGEAGHAHGLIFGFEPVAARALAEHLHRRLSAFRHNQGLADALAPVEVIETTEDDAADRWHTVPQTDAARVFGGFVGERLNVLANRWVGSAWCLAMLAGLFASGRLLVALGLPRGLLFGHVLLGVMHLALLGALWQKREPADTPPDDTTGTK
jgi:hypothetical protein